MSLATLTLPPFGNLTLSSTICCNVILGDPRKNCAGMGVCYIEKIDTDSFSFVAGWEADLCFFGSQFMVMIIKDGINSPQLQPIIDNKSLPMNTPFIMPTDVWNRGDGRKALIPTGVYPVLTTRKDVIILFSLR